MNGYLITNLEPNRKPLPPAIEHGWWYQYYFATDRGQAGYDATYDQTAASFDNPDHVSIVIHNYRWRLSLAPGESQYDDMENRLSAGPVISVPTITLDGDSDGVAPATDGSAYAAKFSGKRTHRIIKRAGHNLPREAPQAFVHAVVEADSY